MTYHPQSSNIWRGLNNLPYGGHKIGIKLSDTHACKECKQLFFTIYPVENCKEHLGVEPLYTNKRSK